MSGAASLSSTLESVISRSVASKANAAEEALKNNGVEQLLRAALRLHNEPSTADFEAKYIKELENLKALVKDEYELVRKVFNLNEKEEKAKKVATSKAEKIGMTDENDLWSELNRSTVDLTEESPEGDEPKKGPQKSDLHVLGDEDEHIYARSETMERGVESESSDNKDWLQDNDDDTNHNDISDDEEPILHRGISRNTLLGQFHLGSSLRERCISPNRTEKPDGNSEQMISPCHQRLLSGRRPHPRRRTVTRPQTYNVKAIFKSQVGSLYGPEHRLS